MLLENVKIDGATGIIINVTGGSDLSLYEVNEASMLITEAASEDAEVIFGAVIDPNLIDEVCVTVIATGFAREEKKDVAANNTMQSFLTGPSIMFDLPQQPMMPQQLQQQQIQQQQAMYAQMMAQNQYTQTMAQPMNPMMPNPMMQPQTPVPVQAQILPTIQQVQESVKTLAQMEPALENTMLADTTFATEMDQDLSSAVSPTATSSQTARDLLLAKAKAFRETQTQTAHSNAQSANEEKTIHPEQLSMMDEDKQIEEARKMARDILEVPAFIRKKQGFDLST